MHETMILVLIAPDALKYVISLYALALPFGPFNYDNGRFEYCSR